MRSRSIYYSYTPLPLNLFKIRHSPSGLSGLLTGLVKLLFSAKSNQKLSATPLASKGSARARAVDAATAKAELGVNGCLCLGSTIELLKYVISY